MSTALHTPPANLPEARMTAPSAHRLLPTVDTRDLFRNGRELVIQHRGEEYRLRLTRNDKLILNK